MSSINSLEQRIQQDNQQRHKEVTLGTFVQALRKAETLLGPLPGTLYYLPHTTPERGKIVLLSGKYLLILQDAQAIQQGKKVPYSLQAGIEYPIQRLADLKVKDEEEDDLLKQALTLCDADNQQVRLRTRPSPLNEVPLTAAIVSLSILIIGLYVLTYTYNHPNDDLPYSMLASPIFLVGLGGLAVGEHHWRSLQQDRKKATFKEKP